MDRVKLDPKKILTGISGLALLAALSLDWLARSSGMVKAFSFISLFSGGYFVLLAAIRGLFGKKFLNIEFLVIVAVGGAIYIGQPVEAAAVIFFFSLAEAFEQFGIERSQKALEALVKKSPQTATLESGQKVRVEEVEVKDVILVRPGDLIPLDGVVVKGSSSVDEATITGESVPRDKGAGDKVFSGTLNLNGYMEVEVTKKSKDSTFSKIIELVGKAQQSRAPAQKFIDLFAKYYTPSVVFGAAFIAGLPPLFWGGMFRDWLYRALTLLVIACPCALVISTPVSIASAIGGASRKGVLIKGGKYLEAIGKTKAVAFDKTKTLTVGEPYISEIAAFDGFSEEEVLADAAGIEKFSSHPLSRSILDFARSRGVKPHAMEGYENIAGKGGKATCLVCNDLEHCIGSLRLIQAGSDLTREVLEQTDRFEREGKTVALISGGNEVEGALAITDKIRPEAKEMVEKIHLLDIETIMVTGDNPHTANFAAQMLGIGNVFAALLPEEKVQRIEELKKEHGFVAMVGDGVNDAPSLATASVGIAMGAGGSDVAIETADVALMNSNLLNIPHTIVLGRKALKTIKHNIAASLGVKVIFLVLALFGFTRLEYAIGADSGIAILVIFNSLRLFHFGT